MPPSKMKILSLYRTLLREMSKFPSYNFREYGLRRIRDGFRRNKTISNPQEIENIYQDGIKMLEVIKRQAAVSTLYKTDNLVIENKSK